MIPTFRAAMRRTNRFTDAGKQIIVTQSLQKMMSGFVIESAFSPLAVFNSAAGTASSSTSSKPDDTVKTVNRRQRGDRSPGALPKHLSDKRKDAPRGPKGARYLTRTHRSVAGSRGYKLYLPASQKGPPKGLIVMLHGCKQTPDDFAVGTHMNALAEKYGLAVAYPAQTRRHNASSCWNWFKPGNQMRNLGEPAILASLTRKLMRDFGLGRSKVFVAGLSAGGAMAAILADVYPDVFSAAGIHSGLARGAASGAVSAMSAMRNGGVSNGIAPFIASPSRPVRRIIFQGEDDQTVNPSNASQIVAAEIGDDILPTTVGKRTKHGRGYCRSVFADSEGAVQIELWMIAGSGHAWSGGRAAGSYTDTKGPDASAQMVRFFLDRPA